MSTHSIIHQFIDELEALIPEYRRNPADDQWSQGHLAVAVIDTEGNLYGKVFGPNQAKAKGYLQTAMRKVIQVWLTGHPTGDFERQIFAGQLSESDFPIQKPDYVGWEGGLPLTIAGITVAAAFSGFEGHHDQEILRRAAEKVSSKA